MTPAQIALTLWRHHSHTHVGGDPKPLTPLLVQVCDKKKPLISTPFESIWSKPHLVSLKGPSFILPAPCI